MVFKKRKTVPFLSEQRKKQPCEIRRAAFISQRELLVVGLNRFRRSTAGNEDLNDGVAAETVAAMDTAGDLASRIQAGDHVAIGIQRMALGVNLDTAHGMVGGRSHEADTQLHAVELVGFRQVIAVLVLIGRTDQGVRCLLYTSDAADEL